MHEYSSTEEDYRANRGVLYETPRRLYFALRAEGATIDEALSFCEGLDEVPLARLASREDIRLFKELLEEDSTPEQRMQIKFRVLAGVSELPQVRASLKTRDRRAYPISDFGGPHG